MVHTLADDFAQELEILANTPVSEHQWRAFLDAHVPLDDGKGHALEGRSRTMAPRKRGELENLYRHDERAAPWTGTALGVLQATNTWAHHFATSRGASRPERNLLRPSPEQRPRPTVPCRPPYTRCLPRDPPAPLPSAAGEIRASSRVGGARQPTWSGSASHPTLSRPDVITSPVPLVQRPPCADHHIVAQTVVDHVVRPTRVMWRHWRPGFRGSGTPSNGPAIASSSASTAVPVHPARVENDTDGGRPECGA